MQLLLHLPGLWATGRNPHALPAPVDGMNPALRFAPTRPLRRVLMLSLPLFAYVSLSQVMTLIERVFASHLGTGAVARLTLAQKLASLPLFLVAGSLAVVIFPRLAAAESTRAACSAAVESGLRTELPRLLWATGWLMSGSQLRVALLYSSGRERSKTNNIRIVHEQRVALRELGRRAVAAGHLDSVDQIFMLSDNPDGTILSSEFERFKKVAEAAGVKPE